MKNDPVCQRSSSMPPRRFRRLIADLACYETGFQARGRLVGAERGGNAGEPDGGAGVRG